MTRARAVQFPTQTAKAIAAFALAVAVLLASLLSDAAAQGLNARDFTTAGDGARTRVVIDFDGEPDPKWFLLRGPHRLVVDLPDTRLVFEPSSLKAKGLLRTIRYGRLDGGTSRLILGSKGPFVVKDFQVLPNEGGTGFRVAIDLEAAPEAAFEEALSLQAETTGSTTSTPKGDRVRQVPENGQGPFTVVLDPGHGGIDGGAEGLNGTVEKAITLAFAKQLRDTLQQTGRYEVFLTREGDEFLALGDRVRIARQHAADLFISIHADTINLKGISGATVYTVSDKASDAEAEATALRENLSDELAGLTVDQENQQVADILIDLIRRETHGFSIRFARSLIGELSETVNLINNPHRYAGFRVLKAPDVPSVLLELGYLSNPSDEEQLKDEKWRERAAGSIVKAVDRFAEARPGAGG